MKMKTGKPFLPPSFSVKTDYPQGCFVLNRKGLGPNQQKILDFLKAYPDSTVTEIAELLFPKENIIRSGKRYNSVCRSFHLLEVRGLIGKEGGRAKWKVTEEKPK